MIPRLRSRRRPAPRFEELGPESSSGTRVRAHEPSLLPWPPRKMSFQRAGVRQGHGGHQRKTRAADGARAPSAQGLDGIWGAPVSAGASRFDEVRLGPGAPDFDLDPKDMLHQACTGVDVSKDTLDFALTLDGERFSMRTFSNDKKGHKAAWEWLSEEAGGPWRLALEATSAYHKAFVAFFSGLGARPLVLNPKQARDLARGLGVLRKDDATDARVLAMCAVMAWREPEALPDAASETLQELSRRLDVLARLAADERKRLQKPGAGKGLLESVRRHLKWLVKEIERLEGEWLEAVVGCPRLFRAYSLALGVPGVGHKTARVVVSELYAAQRQRTVRQCAAYAGLAPHERTSGTSLRRPGRTVSTGNKRLRSALYMAAVSTLRHDAECRDLYLRVTGQGEHAKVGIVAVMNKLLRRIAAVVERGTPYVRI